MIVIGIVIVIILVLILVINSANYGVLSDIRALLIAREIEESKKD